MTGKALAFQVVIGVATGVVAILIVDALRSSARGSGVLPQPPAPGQSHALHG
jgi:hypothetical protein